VIQGFVCSGSDLITLLKACCRAIGEPEEDAVVMAGMVAEGREVFVEEVFALEA
jgi:hypothetical protein